MLAHEPHLGTPEQLRRALIRKAKALYAMRQWQDARHAYLGSLPVVARYPFTLLESASVSYGESACPWREAVFSLKSVSSVIMLSGYAYCVSCCR